MTSQTTPRKILKLTAFKDKFQAALDNVFDEAEKLQTTAGNPVVLNRAWVLNKMKDQIVQDKYVLEPGPAQITVGLGHLHKLPRELRDLIYGYTIVDGNMTIMRASKQTHKEASKLIFQKGIYRLNLGFKDRVVNPPLSQSLAKNICNLNIRINSLNWPIVVGYYQNLPILHMFDGSNIERKNCVVTNVVSPWSLAMTAAPIISALKDFTGFERVILEQDLDPNPNSEPWLELLNDEEQGQIRARIKGAFHYQKMLLEPYLGKEDYVFDEVGLTLHLVFHPRERRPTVRPCFLD